MRQISIFLLVIFSRFVSVAQDWQYGTRCKIVATTPHLAGRPYRQLTPNMCACVRLLQAVAAIWSMRWCSRSGNWRRRQAMLCYDIVRRIEPTAANRVGALLLCQFGCACWCGHALAAIRLVSTCHVMGLWCASTVYLLPDTQCRIWSLVLVQFGLRKCEIVKRDERKKETGILWTAIGRRVGASNSKRLPHSRTQGRLSLCARSPQDKKMLSLFLCFLLYAPVISTRGHSTYVPSNRLRAGQKKREKIECTNLHTLDDVAHT